ncbi:MAG: serine/threonine protein kinase, partial [Treponema sp.]|nr:serine/threonine protein kinase [Treponema sp.]
MGQGTYGRVFLFKREEYGKTYFCAIKHISIPTYPKQEEDLFAEGLATDNASLHAYCAQLLESFMSEVSINVELRGHSNFVSYDDHQIIPRKGGPGYDIYIKMEYLTNLNTYLRQHPLTLADALRIGEDICTALSVLQRRNLIHRDIKPENIFINEDGNFKLGDFGIARSLDEAVTRMSARGTLTFMAPELVRHERSDFRVDLYSLGLVLYRLCNGNRAPFLPPLPTPVAHFEHNSAQDLRINGERLPPP